MDDGSETIKVTELKKFVSDCFLAIGVSKPHAEIMADAIVGADLIGHRSHGVFRLDRFVADQTKHSDVTSDPFVMKENAATAWVNGNNALGPVVGKFCMNVAMAKAKETGASVVVANNSNNFGVASYFSRLALDEGLVALVTTNASPLLLPTRGKDSLTGTNPISLAAPADDGDYFLLDMATSIVSGGNVEIKYLNDEFLPIGWALNPAYLPESNADVAFKSKRFLPVGSSEETGSYKGTGLSIMVDILCGVLSGANYTDHVGIWLDRASSQKANVGHCFIVIDPNRFAPNFETRLSEFMSSMRNLKPTDPGKPVHIPGDKSRQMAEYLNEKGGIWYPSYVIESLKSLSARLKIKCVAFIPKVGEVKLTMSEELALHLEQERREREAREAAQESSRSSYVSTQSDPDREVSYAVQDSDEWLCPFDEPPRPPQPPQPPQNSDNNQGTTTGTEEFDGPK